MQKEVAKGWQETRRRLLTLRDGRIIARRTQMVATRRPPTPPLQVTGKGRQTQVAIDRQHLSGRRSNASLAASTRTSSPARTAVHRTIPLSRIEVDRGQADAVRRVCCTRQQVAVARSVLLVEAIQSVRPCAVARSRRSRRHQGKHGRFLADQTPLVQRLVTRSEFSGL